MNLPGYGKAVLAVFCLFWMIACAHTDETGSNEAAQRVLAVDQVGFDFADGIKLPEDTDPGQKVFTLKNFRVGTGPNRILIVGVQFELQGKASGDNTAVSSVMYGGREATLLPGSEVQFTWNWKGVEIWFKVVLYYLLNPPSGRQDITVTYDGPVPSGNVGAISLYNAKQVAPLILATNYQSERKNKIITKVTTKNDGAWVVDWVGCNHTSSLKPQKEGHSLRFNAQEFFGGKSSLVGGTLPVPSAGEVTLEWAMKKHNRLAHIVLEVDYFR